MSDVTGYEWTVRFCLLLMIVAVPAVGAGSGVGTETPTANTTATPTANTTATPTPDDTANGTEPPTTNATETPTADATANGTEPPTTNATETPTADATATPAGNDQTITPSEADASVTVSPQITVAEVTVDEARLGAGGFLVVKRVPAFEIIGTSSYIESGRVTDVVIELDREIITRTPIVVEVWLDDGDEQFEPNEDVRYRADDGFPVQDRTLAAPEELPEASTLTSDNGTAVSTPVPDEDDGSVVPELSPAASVVVLFGGTVLLVFAGGFLLYWLR